MVVYVVPSQQLTRAAFVCGRRIGGAVVRNRGRRLLREAWRTLAARVQRLGTSQATAEDLLGTSADPTVALLAPPGIPMP